MAEVKDLIVYGSSNLIGESFSDIIHSNSFKTNGGTSSQFVKGDGSLDDSEYITDVTVGGNSVVDSNGVAVVPAIPDSTSDLVNDSGFVTSADIPTPADTAPLMDGTAAVGTSTDYAREDHVHPSDTSKQNVLVAGRDIDIQDIVEVEYLESTGTQYIDTGITGDQDTKIMVEVSYYVESSIATSGRVLGSRDNTTTNRLVIGSNTGRSSESTYNFAQYGSKYSQAASNIVFGAWKSMKVEPTGYYIDGVLQGSSFSADTFTTPQTMKLFAFDNNGVVGCGVIRVKSLQLIDGVDLVRDFIPVRVGNVGYMYDSVSGTLFGNAGTGDFVLGSDVRPLSLISFVNNDGFITISELPTKTSDLTNDGSDGTSTYVEADELALVATSGNYNDLTNTPTIPTVNNATLTITQGGATKGTFTANASSDVTINLDSGGGGSAGTLDTTNTTALTPSASESLGGSVSLHKVSKTGTYSDLIGTPTYALGESVGGPAASTVSMPYGTIDGTSTSTEMTATVSGITALRDGITCVIVNNVVTSASGVTLNVNNLGPKPIYCFYDDTTQATTFFTVGKTCMFVYDSTKVSGGCWNLMYPFNPSISASTYLIRTYYSTLPLATALGRYRLLFISADGTKFVPANSSTSTSATSAKTVTTEKIDPFGKIVYYNTTTTRTAGQTVDILYQYLQNSLTLGYSFNRTGVALTLTTNTPVYVKCTPQTDGSVIIDGTTPFVQALPNTEDGYVYIYLGIATSATQIELMMNHPVYWYKGGIVREWTNGIAANDSNLVHKTSAETIAGIKTFNDDVNIVDSSLVIDTNDQNKHNVYINLDNYHDDGGDGIAVLALDDPSGEGNVIIRDVASPISSNDAANKQYVDTLHRYNSVILNGLSGAYGIHEKSLCACANWANDTMGLMSSFTTVGGTHTSKSTDIGVTFPIGCKIYYHPDDTAFTNNTSFTGKKFYSTYDSVDARYTAVEGYNVSLSNGGASNVYLKVQVVFANATTRWTPFYDKTTVSEIIITSDDLESDNFYIYLGKTNASNVYQFQLEENNPLYYYDGAHLINWASYIADFYGGSTYTAGNGIRIDSNNVISTRVDHPSVTTSSIALDAGKEYSFEGSAFTLITVSFNLIADGLNLFHFNIPPQNSDFNLSLTMPSGVTLSLPPGYSLQNGYIPLSSNIMYEFSVMMTNSKARVLIARWY